MKTPTPRYRDGRDEMNLADFPISALQRTQKADADGRKQDRMEFTATRYDAATRRRLDQKVTLTSTARDGLPTPADEHVVLALLFIAKHADNFADATVKFAPSQLFDIMGWAPNGRSYTRLRDVLRRLKALTIRYENAWWDAEGRSYEEEVATGIVSAYRIARQVSGPRCEGKELASWVTWSPQFQESLNKGNLKRLDLDVFFKLSSPTAQRMYRFLDKRFYNNESLSLDLTEFACGHVGLTEVENVAILKRRLTPAIEELEGIGFILPAAAKERYTKVKVGEWRVNFRRGASVQAAPAPAAEPVPETRPTPAPAQTEAMPAVADTPASELAKAFYAAWDAKRATPPGARDVEAAAKMLDGRTPEAAKTLMDALVRITRKEWPECKSLSGAALKYLGDALALVSLEAKREESRKQSQARQQQARKDGDEAKKLAAVFVPLWDALPDEQRRAIEEQVKARLGSNAPAAFVRRLCLEELAKRLGG